MVPVFTTPEWAYLLLLPLIVLLAAKWSDKRAERRRLELTGRDDETLSVIPPGRFDLRRKICFALGLLALIVALMGPRGKLEAGYAAAQHQELVVCLDLSQSMLAQERNMSRLDRAKRQIGALLDAQSQTRVALIVFAGEAELACPLTTDFVSFRQILAGLEPHDLSAQGTNFAAALARAQKCFPANSSVAQTILIISDGEDFGTEVAGAARACRQANISVGCLGIGSELGAKIPLAGGGFLKDESGQEVVSRFTARSLKQVADLARGSFEHLKLGGPKNVGLDSTLLGLARHLQSGQGQVSRDRELNSRQALFQWPLLLCLGLWSFVLFAGGMRP